MILGVDPGMTGALALVSGKDLVMFFDMPLVGKDISPVMLAGMLRPLVAQIDGAVVERVASMPGQGVSSMFKFGMGYGKVLGVIGALGIPLVAEPTPAQWKREMGLGKDKDLSRELAIKTWPDKAEWFTLKKHADRAEAALLALWYLHKQPEKAPKVTASPRVIRRRS